VVDREPRRRRVSRRNGQARGRGAGRSVVLTDTLRALVRDVPDFPTPGIVFKDITPLLGDATGFATVVDTIVDRFVGRGVNRVLGIEARGFIVAAPVAYRLGAGFIPARKKGKLPHDVHGIDYELEYGAERLEVHTDGVAQGDRVLLVDDVLATGGTAAAAVDVVRVLGGDVIGLGFIIELGFLDGRSKLDGLEVFSVLSYN
jgi:adenine phosphoribosyltransferase